MRVALSVQPESLVQLIGSGNSAVVEKEWMRLVESDQVPLSKLPDYAPVLEALCRDDRQDSAGEFAWSALETLSGRHEPQALLSVAGPFLLAVGDHEVLRTQVAELYRQAYADVDGLEDLIKEAGLVAGRPVRRALRTLEVCLPRKEGDYLASRHDEGAARIDAIDRSQWRFTINTGDDVETLGAVHLADAYAPARSEDFQVMRTFAREQLLQRLQKDPTSVVVEMCKRNDARLTIARLEELLVPDLFSEAEWKRWWTRSRAALRKNPKVKLEGRAPYVISYTEQPTKPEEILYDDIRKAHDPLKQLALVDNYLRDCKAADTHPSKDALARCHEFLSKAAAGAAQGRSTNAIVRFAVAARVGVLGDVPNPDQELSALLQRADDFRSMFATLDSEVLVDVVCETLVAVRGDDWQELMLKHLPMFPQGSCERMASRLIQAGRPIEDFQPVVDRILSAPLACFGALLWLWEGSARVPLASNAQPVSVLMRILRALEEARRSESTSKAKLSRIKASVRTTLSARKYERFEACLDDVDAEMAAALRRLLDRSDALGRAVRDDLLRRLLHRFPPASSKQERTAWERDDVLFVTAEGLRRKRDEVNEHVNVKMAANSRAIGKAAEHGDLSENSEFKFALEERDLLRGRLAQMNEELARARVIDPADVPTDHIGIGTKAVFKRTTDGQRYELSFFGPWEANAEQGIINYRAPLAHSLMGKRIGDIVDFDHTGAHGTYELIELHNALAP